MRPMISFLKKMMLLASMNFLFPALSLCQDITIPEDKTESPYFYVQSEQPGIDRLPLKSTRSDVTISGVIADVTVTQVYKNEGKNKLEAVYVFPASTRAAVYAMKMTVGKRVIIAKVQEKQKARETYEQALSEGKTASLLVQKRPNVFQMNVGNILPGDEIKVEMNYTEALVPEDSIYEFVYPAVVGPRYSEQSEATTSSKPNDENWVSNPYFKEGEDAPFTFAFDLTINGGVPISRIYSPSHEIGIEYTGKRTAHIGLKESNKINNRDVVIRYGLAGNQIESGLLLYNGDQEDFFLLMVEPPKRVTARMIVPREYIFVIDVSGSMHGFPIETAKDLMRNLFDDLRPSDTFNVLLFSGGNKVLFDKSQQATKANLNRAFHVIDREHGSGGTQLMPALKRAMTLPKTEKNTSRNFVIVTDGYVSVEKDAFDYIRNNLNKGNVFSFGIGSSINRYLIEGMARAGMGEPLIVLDKKDIKKKADKFKEYIESPVLTDIKVEFKGLKVRGVEPASVPDLFAKKPVMVFGKFHGNPQGEIIISGKTVNGNYRQVINVKDGKLSTNNTALRYLWARHRVMRIADMNKLDPSDERVEEVTRLGLQYNLLTDYTSFVAVDTEKRTNGRPNDTVNQPLPLPQGVSNDAVGGSMAMKSSPAPSYRKKYRSMTKAGRSTSKSGSGFFGRKGKAGLTESLAAPAEFELLDEDKVTEKPKTEPKRTCTITIRKVTGNLDRLNVEKGVAQYRDDLIQMLKKEGKHGIYNVQLMVDKNGRIRAVKFANDTIHSDEMKKKVARLVKKMKFGKTKDGQTANVILDIKVSK